MDVISYVLAKKYTDGQIAGIETGGGQLDYIVVPQLPESGEDGIVYLVPTQVSGQYDEYVWKDSQFKKLNTRIISDIITEGYYFANVFWKDSGHSTRLPDKIDCIYLDIPNSTLYYYNTVDQGYKQFLSINIGPATPTTPGVMKLYETTGDNTDGTISQAVITAKLKDKVELDTTELASDECLGFILNQA